MAPNEVLGTDGKPKGFIRTHRGYLQQREDNEDGWVHAVRHSEVRRMLTHNAALLGAYEFPPRGGSGLNVTSFLPTLQQWGPERADRPPLLFQLEKIPAPSAVPDDMMIARQVVLDQDDHRILDFPELPATLSTELEGHHIELFFRQNDKIVFKDLIARMPEPTPGLDALKVRVQDFRLTACCITWLPQQVCRAMNAQIKRLLGPVCFLNNSSRPFGRDFNHAEVQSILEANNRDSNKRTKNNKGKARQESPESSEDDESDDDNEDNKDNDGDTDMANTHKGEALQESPETSEDDENDQEDKDHDDDTVMADAEANTDVVKTTQSPGSSLPFTTSTRSSRRAPQVSPSPSPASKQLLKELAESTQAPTESAKESSMSSKPPAESSKSRPTLSKPVIGSRISKPEAGSSSKIPAKPSKKTVRFHIDGPDDGKANPKDVPPNDSNDSDGIGSGETERESPPPSPSIEELMNPSCVPRPAPNTPPPTRARTVVIPGWNPETGRMQDGSVGPTNFDPNTFNPNLGFGMNMLHGNNPVRSPPEQQPQAPTHAEQDNQILSNIDVWRAWDHEMAKDDWYRTGGTSRPPPSPPRFSHPNLTFEQNMMVDSPSPSSPVRPREKRRQEHMSQTQEQMSKTQEQTSLPQEMVLDDVWKSLKGEMFDEDAEKLWADHFNLKSKRDTGGNITKQPEVQPPGMDRLRTDRLAAPTHGHSLGHEVFMNLNREKGMGGNEPSRSLPVRQNQSQTQGQKNSQPPKQMTDPPIPFDDLALDDVWKTLRESDDVWKTLKDELYGNNDRWYDDRLAAIGVDIPQDLDSYLKSSNECRKRLSDGFPKSTTIKHPPKMPANKSSHRQSRGGNKGFPTFPPMRGPPTLPANKTQDERFGNDNRWDEYEDHLAALAARNCRDLDTYLKSDFARHLSGETGLSTSPTTRSPPKMPANKPGDEQSRVRINGFPTLPGDTEQMTFYKWLRSQAGCYPGNMDVMSSSIPTCPADVLAVRQSVLDTWGDNVAEEGGDTEREKFLKWMRSGGRCYAGGDDVVEEEGDTEKMKFFKWLKSRAKCYPGSKGSLAWWKEFSGSGMSIQEEVAKHSRS